MRQSLVPSLIVVVFGSILAILVFRETYRTNLDELSAVGRTRVELATNRLSGQLASFVVMINMLVRHPDVVGAIRSGRRTTALQELLVNTQLSFGVESISLVDGNGHVIAHSDPSDTPMRATHSLLASALSASLGGEHSLRGDMRIFDLSLGVIVGQTPPVGAVIVSVDLASLEFEWGIDPEAIGFFDTTGAVFAANRTEMLLRQHGPKAPTKPQYRAFPSHDIAQFGGHEIWRFSEQVGLPDTALVISYPAPRFGMTARGFLDVTSARWAAIISAILALALTVLVALAVLVIGLRRRRMSDQLAFEAAVNAQLEARVSARTAELHDTQEQLVQATKLTALGQMSAGISHELNQPLAAIMNFAENGRRLLTRDRSDDAATNFDKISQQVGRVDRIIRNLRGFARNEEEPVEPVDLARVIQESLALTQSAVDQSGSAITYRDIDTPVMVMGGSVRLQQVIVNIISNALDAMHDSLRREITLRLRSGTKTVDLTIHDTGPGIAEPDKVFDPFYTTKELGASKGLGLGMSISYGIIGSFGGELSCANADEGGGVFTIRLQRAREGS